MLEIGTSGSVRGEDGNILTYSARQRREVNMWPRLVKHCNAPATQFPIGISHIMNQGR
jgi:hypothetical protein